ncbi:MAG: glutathione S-transferase [Pseudomonadota bacterium]
MITVHHLENSRSQRVLWLLEELEVPYEIKRYERDKQTNLAPAELSNVHPLGKSPVIDDDGVVYAETGAIIEHIVDAHGAGRLKPDPGTEEYRRYRYWMHAAEGSYMPPLVTSLFLARMEAAKMPFFAKPVAKRLTQGLRDAYLDHTTKALFDYVANELSLRSWLAGDEFSAADVMMSFPLEAALTRVPAAKAAAPIRGFVERIHARPAYKRALEKGGPYVYA